MDRIPVGITDDETNFILNAKAIFLTGKDIAQVWNPFSLTTITGEFPRAELPYLLMAPFIGLLDFSLFNSRLPYAVVGTSIVLLTSLIAWRLFGRSPALIIALMGAINPWSIFFSRTAFEMPLAIAFFLLGFYILLKVKKWNVLYAAIPFFIAFYCYMGTKLIFFPIIAIFIFYAWWVVQKQKYALQYIVLLFLCIAIFASFILRYNQSAVNVTRGDELYTPFVTTLTAKVDTDRKLSIQTPLTEVYSNKLTIYLTGAMEKYVGAFSPVLLFTNGDGEVHQSLFYHGNFYYIDIIFLLIGLCYLFSYNKKTFLLLLSLILIAPLPSVLSNSGLSYGLRSGLLFPLLIMLVGLGIYTIITLISSKKCKILVSVSLISVYVILFSNFVNIYFFRYPIYNPEAPNFSARVLSRVIFHESAHKKVYVISYNIEGLFSNYIFYNNLYNNTTKNQLAQVYRALHSSAVTSLSFGNLTMMSCPLSPLTISDATVIMQQNTDCKTVKFLNKKNSNNGMYIAALSDGNKLYQLFNADYCANMELDSYPHDITMSDLAIENLSDEKFCSKFISN